MKFRTPLSTTPPTPLTPQSAPPYGTDLSACTGRQLQQQASVKVGDSLLCAVCGDNAVCQHYGVRTCEGCKGFFKVSHSLLLRRIMMMMEMRYCYKPGELILRGNYAIL